jgi:hypothetical protein
VVPHEDVFGPTNLNNNNPKNDFNFSIKLSCSNSPLFTNQIINRFVRQNDKLQI